MFRFIQDISFIRAENILVCCPDKCNILYNDLTADSKSLGEPAAADRLVFGFQMSQNGFTPCFTFHSNSFRACLFIGNCETLKFL